MPLGKRIYKQLVICRITHFFSLFGLKYLKISCVTAVRPESPDYPPAGLFARRLGTFMLIIQHDVHRFFYFCVMVIINGIKEETLVRRLMNADQTAFELLFRFYYPGLVTFATQIVLDPDEAEEIVQDFFVRLWTGRETINRSKNLKSYFFTSVKNRAFNYLKKEKVNERIRQELKKMTEEDWLYQPELFVESELQTQIKTAFGKLSPRTREVFSLSRFQGLSNEQIAEQLAISKRTVETQISNALKILREELKDYSFMLLLF